MTYVPEFPVIESDGIYIRGDGTWGPHDYTRWPQAYSSANLHHVCIPKLPALQRLLKEVDPYSTSLDSLLWDNLDESTWEQNGQFRLINGDTLVSGQVRQSTRDTLLKYFLLFKLRAIQRYTTTEFKDASDYKVVTTITTLGEKVIERLQSVSEPLYGTRSTFRELQRLILELVGLINLVTDVRPRLRDPTYRATEVLPYRGVFCSSGTIHQDLFRVGIPVWYIRHASTMSPSTKIFNVVEPILLSSCLVTDRPRLLGKVVHIGEIPVNLGDLRSPCGRIVPDPAMTDLLRAMRLYSRTDESEPIRAEPPSGPSPSSTMTSHVVQRTQPSPEEPMQSSSVKRTGPDSGFNARPSKRPCADSSQSHAPSGSLLFSIPSGMYPGQRDCPPIARHWLKAITDVGLITKRKPSTTAKYLHPPPFLFSHPNPDRVARYYHNYIRIERFLRHRIKEGSLFGEQSYTIKQWRDILHGDYTQSKDIDPQTAASVIQRLDSTLPDRRHPTTPEPGSSRLHDRKKRGKRAEVRVTLAVQGAFPPYDAQSTVKWWLTGEDVSLQNVKSTRSIREGVLWDVFGTGFILDLWTIDFELVPRSGLSPTAAGRRHLLLASVYNGITADGQYKLSPSGMRHTWSDSPDDKALDSFTRIVRDWPNCPKIILETNVLDCNDRKKDLIFERLAEFFVKTCIDVHDRLPIIPCYLAE